MKEGRMNAIQTFLLPYRAETNQIGVDGYNMPRRRSLLGITPTEKGIKNYFGGKKIDLKSLPIRLESKIENKDLEAVAIASLLHTFLIYGYNVRDLTGLTLRLRRKPPILLPPEFIEFYFTFDKSISLFNIIEAEDFDQKKLLLEQLYHIPRDASPSYIVGYLAAHSSVHAIQHKERRIQNFNPFLNLEEYLQLKIEKEAHNMGLVSVDSLFESLEV